MDRLLIAAIAAGVLAALVHRQLLTLAWGLARALASVRELARGIDRAGIRCLHRSSAILDPAHEKLPRGSPGHPADDAGASGHRALGALSRTLLTLAVLALAVLWAGSTMHAATALTGQAGERAASMRRAAELALAGAVATGAFWLLVAMVRPAIRARLFDLDRVARAAGIAGGTAALSLVVASGILWGGAPGGPMSLIALTLVAGLTLVAAAALGIAGLLETVVLAAGLLTAMAGLAMRGLAVALSVAEAVLQVPRAMLHFLAQAGARRRRPGKA